jgi:hypothetical protein
MIPFDVGNVLALTSMFLLFLDNVLAQTYDLPEKTFFMGAQVLHEQNNPGQKIDTETLLNLRRDYSSELQNLNLKHYWSVQGLSDSARDKLMKVIVESKEAEMTPYQISKEINKEVFEKFSNKALLISRTFITDAEAQGRISYAENYAKKNGLKDVYLQVNSAPDACQLCKTYLNFINDNGKIIEGKIFPASFLKKQKSNLGKATSKLKPNIPMHFNCRCLFLMVPEIDYEIQQEKIKMGELKNRDLEEVTKILKSYEPNFEKINENIKMEKSFEIDKEESINGSL